MIRKEFPQLREHYYESVLPCGLTVRVVPRPGFSRKHAFLAVRCGSSDVSFTLGDRKVLLPAAFFSCARLLILGIAIVLSVLVGWRLVHGSAPAPLPAAFRRYMGFC